VTEYSEPHPTTLQQYCNQAAACSLQLTMSGPNKVQFALRLVNGAVGMTWMQSVPAEALQTPVDDTCPACSGGSMQPLHHMVAQAATFAGNHVACAALGGS
jgi:hypothetical protein